MYIKIRVITGAKKESLVVESSDHYKISVKEEPERNLANKRIVEIVRQHLALIDGNIRIVSGHHSPSKILSVDKKHT